MRRPLVKIVQGKSSVCGFQEKQHWVGGDFSPHIILGGVHVKLWAAITIKSFLGFAFFDRALDANSYLKILK